MLHAEWGRHREVGVLVDELAEVVLHVGRQRLGHLPQLAQDGVHHRLTRHTTRNMFSILSSHELHDP